MVCEPTHPAGLMAAAPTVCSLARDIMTQPLAVGTSDARGIVRNPAPRPHERNFSGGADRAGKTSPSALHLMVRPAMWSTSYFRLRQTTPREGHVKALGLGNHVY